MDFKAIEQALVSVGKALVAVVQRLDQQIDVQKETLEVLKEIRDKGN